MDKLNQRLEREVVTNVFFVLGEFPSEPPPEASNATVPAVDATRLPEGGAGPYRGSRAPELLETTVAEPTEETGLGSCIGRRYDPDTGGFETRPYTGCPVAAAQPPSNPAISSVYSSSRR